MVIRAEQTEFPTENVSYPSVPGDAAPESKEAVAPHKYIPGHMATGRH